MSLSQYRILRLFGLLLLFPNMLSPVPLLCQTNASDRQQSSPGPAPDITRARQLAQAGKSDEAVAILKALDQQKSNTPGLAHELGAIYYKKGDPVAAIPYFKRAIDQDQQDLEAIQLLGLAYFQTGRPAEAIPLLKRVASLYPAGSVNSSYALGLAYIQTHSYPDARKAFAQMYGVPEDSAVAYLFLARMLLRQGYDPIAEENARKAVALDPKLPLGHFLLGEFYLYKSDLANAKEEFDQEIKLNPAYAGTYDRLADTYTRLGKYDDAERLLQRAILLDANATGPYILMGKVQVKKMDYVQAASYLERAIRMDPNNYIAHHLLGEAYRGMGKAEAAERELKLAEQLQSAQHPQLENIR
jgi:tetratricopeptide (TPR) repeat protein